MLRPKDAYIPVEYAADRLPPFAQSASDEGLEVGSSSSWAISQQVNFLELSAFFAPENCSLGMSLIAGRMWSVLSGIHIRMDNTPGATGLRLNSSSLNSKKSAWRIPCVGCIGPRAVFSETRIRSRSINRDETPVAAESLLMRPVTPAIGIVGSSLNLTIC
jgi:hypothetical protein